MPLALPLLLAYAALIQGQAADRDKLTTGVTELAAMGGTPGVMCASGSPSFVVLTGEADGARVPLFVASHVGKGRALAGGHGCFFGPSQTKNDSNRRFTLNALSWLGGKPLSQIRVGFLDLAPPTDLLAEFGIQEVALDRAKLVDQLAQVDEVWLGEAALDNNADAQAGVLQFVRAGGGLLIAGPGWGWQQLHPGKSLQQSQTGNRLLGDFGIHFTGEVAGPPFSASGADDPALSTFGAMEELEQPHPTPAQVKAGISILDLAIQVAPPGDTSLTDQISALAKKESDGAPMPTLKNPITWATPFLRLQARLDVRNWRSAPVAAVKKDPTADTFPGAVPGSARRVSKQVQVDTNQYGWHATGMYAAPGEAIQITIPESATSANLEVRIGPQTDTLWHLDDWKRFPEISELVPLKSEATGLASPFGGLIYIVAPRGCTLGPIPVKIENAVAAPLYQLGKTNTQEWVDAKEAQAPWADLVGKHVSLSLPSSAIAKLEDPAALMRFWDEVMRNCCDLYSVPPGDRQERYCVDRQIGGGYMHSGYPIMTWEDVAETFADLSKLTAKGHTWGFYHEMGHNFQQSDWTFEGTGEVTNNLFSVYGNEMINGITPDTYGLAHPAIEPQTSHDRLVKYLAAGAPYSQWTSDPFLALSMYLQLRVGFGWEPFKKVFAEYRTLGPGEHPKTDEDKRDQWMIRFSKMVHRNLGPFFVAWGVPTSEAARQSIADLPGWMPTDWPAKS